MKLKKHPLLAAACSLLLLTPAGGAETKKPAAKTQKPQPISRIIDGTRAPASTYPTVAKITDATGILASGTLIAPQYVLTAGHVVTDGFGNISMGDTAGRVTIGGTTYNTIKIYLHPTYQDNAEAENEYDAAILKLETPVTGITPSPLYRRTPTVGTTLTIVGYGLEGTGATGEGSSSPPDGWLSYGTTPLDKVTTTYLKWNFEDTTPPESNTAHGDSGGPAFITEGGTQYVAGITSGGNNADASFGDLSYDTRVDAIAAWIDGIAGTSPVPTAPTITGATVAYGGVGEPFSYVVTAAGNPTPTFSVSGLPAWASLSGATVSGTPTATGTFSVTLTATNSEGSDTKTLTLTVLTSTKPTIVSSPVASPDSAALLQTVTFTAAASDPTGATPTYSWDFGDGLTGLGSTVTHAYATVGNYTVTLTATGSTGTTTTAATTVAVYDLLYTSRVNIRVAHGARNRGRDAVSAKFLADLPVDFNFSGAEFRVVIAGVEGTVTYTAKGKHPRGGNVKIKVRPSRRIAEGATTVTAKVNVRIKNRDLRTVLETAGMGNITTDRIGELVETSVMFVAEEADGTIYKFGETILPTYKSKQDRNGRARY